MDQGLGMYMSRCPKCGSNIYMRIIGWTTSRPTCQKVMNQQLTQDTGIGALFGCHSVSSGCCERQKVGKTGNRTRDVPSRFTSYTGDIWKQYPISVRRRYLDYVQDIEDRETELMMSPGYADWLLFNKGSFEEFARQIEMVMNLLDQAATNSYRDFIMDEAEKFPEKLESTPESIHEKFRKMKWPGYACSHDPLNYFKSPGAATVIKMFHCLYEKIEPHLLRDLLTRFGGKLIRVDGTYNAMKRTMDTPDAEEQNNCLVKILGKYNHVLSFAFRGSEGKLVKERLCWFLWLRYIRLGGLAYLYQVLAGYGDLCCNNGDPKKHWLTALFPKCLRGFIKDIWHAVEQVKRETKGFGHDMHHQFCKELWNSVLKWEPTSFAAAFQHFKANRPEGRLSSDAAIEAMFKIDRCKNSIYNYTPSDEKSLKKIVTDVKELYNRTKGLDLLYTETAKSENRSYIPYCTTACDIAGHQRIGTEQANANFIGDAAKGCYSDPFPWKAMEWPKSLHPPKDEGPI